MRNLVVIAVGLLHLGAGAALAGPTATVNDVGEDNTTTIDQTGVDADADFSATVNQDGEAVTAYIEQSGDGIAETTVNQAGEGNQAFVFQYDDGSAGSSVNID